MALGTTRLDCIHFLWRESRSPEHALFTAPTPPLPRQSPLLGTPQTFYKLLLSLVPTQTCLS